jgi:hypothetical protein
MPPKRFSTSSRRIARQLEGLEHDLGLVVADRARDQLIAVAGQVVLIAQHLQRIALSASIPPCGIENGLWLKSIFPVVGVLLVHREIDDPGEAEAVGFGQPQLAPDLVAGRPPPASKPRACRPGRRPHRPPSAQLLADRLGPLGADVLGDGAGGFHRCHPRPRARRCSPSPAAPPSGQRRSSGRRRRGCRRWARGWRAPRCPRSPAAGRRSRSPSRGSAR